MPEFEAENAPTAIDLFAGCGGFTTGAMQGGFEVRAAWETDPFARYTYHTVHCEANPLSLHGDATEVDPEKAPDDLDAIFAGPSCQGLSAAGGEINPDDPRNEHAFVVIDWVEATTPKVVCIENVVGLTELHSPLHQTLTKQLSSQGYTVNTIALNAADYGVPQTRKRVFIIGIRDDHPTPSQWEPPQSNAESATHTLGGQTLDGYETAQEALEDLPEPLEQQPPTDDPVHSSMADYISDPNYGNRHQVDPHSLPEPVQRDGQVVFVPPNHVAADHSRAARERMAEMEQGHCGNRTTARRLHPDKPSPTLTVSQGTPPVHYQGASPENGSDISSVRRLTVRECARLMTFPDDWYTFAGTKKDQFRQVCNAVPPILAAHLADHLRREVIEQGTSATQPESVSA